MGRSGDLRIEEEADGTVVLRPSGGMRAWLRWGHRIALGLVASSGLVDVLVAEPGQVGVFGLLGVIVGGTVAAVSSMLAMLESGAGGGALLDRPRRVVIEGREGELRGYRKLREPELRVDGRRFPVSSVREVVCGHFVMSDRHERRHLYPVYVVLERHVVCVASTQDEALAREAAERVARQLGSAVQVQETGQLVGCAGILVPLASVLAHVVLLVLGLAIHLSFELRGATASRLVGFPLAMASILGVSHWGLSGWLGPRLRRSVDARVREVFGLGSS